MNHTLFIVMSLVLIASAYGASNKKCVDQERDALLDFKTNIRQDPYGRLSTWRVEEEGEGDCCKWNGVTCMNETGHVTKLDVSGDGLEGEISPSLLNLTYLTYLDLHWNSINGNIPDSIGSLTELRYLDLGGNALNGIIPDSIGSLTKLTYLDLSSNSFNGTISKSVGSLIELRYLGLSYNYFLKGTIPSEFGNLVNMEELSLVNLTSCTIENIEWLSHMSQLRNLYMDGTSLAKANNWVNAILNLQKLSYLSLSDCNLSRVMHPFSTLSFNSSISSSSSIVILNLGNNNLNSSMYDWLFPLTGDKLVNLNLRNNNLNSIMYEYLGNLCSLISLDLTGNSEALGYADVLRNLSGCTSVSLKYLDASSSHFIGSLSDDIQNFLSLENLRLSHNRLNGTISEKVWELPNLHYLDLSSNSLRGPISQNIGKTTISYIDVSNNSLEGVPSRAHMLHLSNDVEYIDINSCNLGPLFPKWIQTLKNLTYLNIANNGISDTIPVDFWNTWPSQLSYLNLSSNNISGKIPDLVSNFEHQFSTIDLSSNHFSGPILNISSTFETLNLSKNKFNGSISFLCQFVNGFLSFLDLSDNSFTGQIPNCLWLLKGLTVLNLRNNNLSGRIPESIESLIRLEVLYLYNNSFSGELPLSLKNCTKLNFLDLGANKFSGNVPVWMGENLAGLYALSLKSNHFFGPIPLQLCQLVHLQILDLSMNNLYGTIPSCVSNLTSMAQKRFSSTQNIHSYYIPLTTSRHSHHFQYLDYVDYAMIQWQGNIREFSSTLGLLTSIDLSSNNLSGGIPYELTDLRGLLALNISNNALRGEIPWNIGEMKRLLILDLSRNTFSGEIPSSMSEITSLSYLDVSYNNLSGRIPSSTQLQSFPPSSYIGNAGLCGPPKSDCPDSDTIGESKGDKKKIDELHKWFNIGGATGFPIGFWTVCSALLLNRRGRHMFFNFLDDFGDWFYVKLVIFIAKLQRAARP